MRADPAGAAGASPRLFARFAYPPNSLGYCGPEESQALLRAASHGGGAGVRALAQRFEGAWPYLELIAAENGIVDPLDGRVVEAYWIGNRLLDGVEPERFAGFVLEHFGVAAADDPRTFEATFGSAARPHHNFHVFAVYPWVALLKAGRTDEPLHVLEKCRVRWGQVQDVWLDEAVVRGRGLEWVRGELRLGEPRLETVAFRHDGTSLIEPPEPGSWVAMHWEWICDVLTPEQVVELSAHTARQLEAVNSLVLPAAR